MGKDSEKINKFVKEHLHTFRARREKNHYFREILGYVSLLEFPIGILYVGAFANSMLLI